MKGVIFNVVEEVVVDLWSDDVWDDILDRAGLDGAYTSLGNYADDQLLALVEAASQLTGMTAAELTRTIGRQALPRLIERLPDAMDGVDDGEALLRRVNDIIHPEVLKLYPDAAPPVFGFEDTDAGLEVTYRSVRRLDQLAAGLIEGCGDLFDQTIELTPIPERSRDGVFVWVARFGPRGDGT